MKVIIVEADTRLQLTKTLSTVYEKYNKNLNTLDKLYKKSLKLNDQNLSNSLREAIANYSKAVDNLFDAKQRIWQLED